WIFENSVPGLPEAAKKDGLTPLAYMRKYGAFLVEDNVYRTYESPQDNGVVVDGVARVGFPTPSRKLEFFSKTLKDWKWPGRAVVHRARRSHARGARQVADAAAARHRAVRERRSRLRARLVGGRRRAPEPHVPGPAGSDQRPALLAPEGDRVEARPRRALRRRLRGHRQVVRGLSRVAGAGAAGAGPGQSAPTALAAARLQARPVRVPAGAVGEAAES